MTLRKLTRDILAYPPLTSLVTQMLSPWVTIFMLHRIEVPELGISGLNQNYLRRCLHYLKDNQYQFISVEDAISKASAGSFERRKWVAFSLDDGNHEQASVAARIFHEFNCPSTCFLISDYIDGKSWPWDYKLKYVVTHAKTRTVQANIGNELHTANLDQDSADKTLISLIRKLAPRDANDVVLNLALLAGVEIPASPPEEFAPASWEEIRAAENYGMQFGAHSITHRNLSGLSDEDLNQEIRVSINRVFSECKNPSHVFCYPSGKAGEFDKRAIQILRDASMIGALSAEPGYMGVLKIQKNESYRYTVPRLTIPSQFNDFKLYVSWAQYLRERMASNPLDKFFP